MESSSHAFQKGEADHLSKASPRTKALYHRYRETILKFGEDVTINPTEKKYIGFRVNDRRFAAFRIHPGHFRVWLRIKPGLIDDPKNLTHRTQDAYAVSLSDDQHLNDIVDLLKQAYVRNR